MSDEKMSDREKALQHIMERAQRDSVFRAELEDNPRAVIERELGIELPADADIRIVEEAPNQVHLILPIPSDELSDAALEEVSGGLSSLRTYWGRLPRYPGATVS